MKKSEYSPGMYGFIHPKYQPPQICRILTYPEWFHNSRFRSAGVMDATFTINGEEQISVKIPVAWKKTSDRYQKPLPSALVLHLGIFHRSSNVATWVPADAPVPALVTAREITFAFDSLESAIRGTSAALETVWEAETTKWKNLRKEHEDRQRDTQRADVQLARMCGDRWEGTLPKSLPELEKLVGSAVDLAGTDLRTRLIALVSEFQDNGGSRELADPSVSAWHWAARRLLDVIDQEAPLS